VSIGLHLGSVHLPQESQNNVNPGIYMKDDALIAGYYRNSWKRDSFYAAYSYPLGAGFELMAGGATGYQKTADGRGFSRYKVTPLVGLTYAPPIKVMGLQPRFWMVPPTKDSSAVIHLSFEVSQ
jgi:hypothetical protein